MERYDYRYAIKNDILEVLNYGEYDSIIEEHENDDELFEALYEAMWIDDSITGNASGSYTCNAWYAEEYIAHNWDLIADLISEQWIDKESITDKGAEFIDVSIRCYLLGECLAEALEEFRS